jgi:hypothetical protein
LKKKVLLEMKNEQDYIRDIAEIRSMMERSSKFLSLTGMAGIMAGIYALAGTFIAYSQFKFNPYDNTDRAPAGIGNVIWLASAILILALGTAIILTHRKGIKKGEKIWNGTSRKLLITLAVPLVTGGILMLIMTAKGYISLLAPFSLIFYGLAIYNAGGYTYEEVRMMGVIEILLGLICSAFPEYGLIFWGTGFGAVHIIYGIFLHYKYER